jgi:hypothetical protein
MQVSQGLLPASDLGRYPYRQTFESALRLVPMGSTMEG